MRTLRGQHADIRGYRDEAALDRVRVEGGVVVKLRTVHHVLVVRETRPLGHQPRGADHEVLLAPSRQCASTPRMHESFGVKCRGERSMPQG
jgi:hypothetical protein